MCKLLVGGYTYRCLAHEPTGAGRSFYGAGWTWKSWRCPDCGVVGKVEVVLTEKLDQKQGGHVHFVTGGDRLQLRMSL
jgi:hypothetical protein